MEQLIASTPKPVTANQQTILTALQINLANAPTKPLREMAQKQIEDFKAHCQPKPRTRPKWVDEL